MGKEPLSDNRGHSPTDDKPVEKKAEKSREQDKKNDEIDRAADDSFPASDPPPINPGSD